MILGAYGRQDLLGFGLRVESLDSEGVGMAIAYQSKRPVLSLVDSFALALANHHGWYLLTEDRIMRQRRPIRRNLTSLDALWVIDNMLTAGILSGGQVVAALEGMRDDPRCPVPNRELALRLRRLRV